MTVRVYKSTDASAPTLSGSAGSLCTVLDAVLVNGYGSQAAAGWSIAFTGTNKRHYAMGAGGTGFTVYIDDSAPTTAKEARMTGFQTATALGTGTGQFPTFAQINIGIGAVVIRKSTTADATARAWTILADAHTFYMFFETGDYTAPVISYPTMFGDFFTYGSADLYNCIIIGRAVENNSQPCTNGTTNSASYWDGFSSGANLGSTGMSNVQSGHYVASNYTGLGGAVQVGKHAETSKMGSPNWPQWGRLGTMISNGAEQTWTTEFVYPNPPDSGLYVSPIYIHHSGFVRGYLKGIWCPQQHLPLNHNDAYSGTGNMAGKSLLAMSVLGCPNTNTAPPVGVPAQVHIETSDTWGL